MRLIYLALGWCAGIILAGSGQTQQPPVWVGLSLVAGLLLAILWRWQRLRWPALALVAFTLGGLRFSFTPSTSPLAQFNNTGGLTLTGVIITEPDVRDDRVLLRLQAESLTAFGRTQATAGLALVEAPRYTLVRYGDRITATGDLFTPGAGDTFSYRDFLARGAIFSQMPNAAVEVIQHGQGTVGFSLLYALKARAAEAINQALPEPQAGLLNGILLGNQRGLSPDLEDAFSRVGASHVIAISGFNMVILSGTVMTLLNRLHLGRGRTALIGVIVIALYALFVGASAAVLRAALMTSLLVIAEGIRRKTYAPASLAFAVIALSLLTPTILWDVGFQLSFFATLGLVLFADPLQRWLTDRLEAMQGRLGVLAVIDWLKEPLLVTLAVQITTLPLTILYFEQFSPALLLVNLLIVPAQSALLIIGLLAVLVSIVSPALAQLLFWVDMLFLTWTIEIVRLFARQEWAAVALTTDPRLIALYLSLLMGSAVMLATQPTWYARFQQLVKGRAALSSLLMAGAALSLLQVSLAFSRPDGKLHVWFLNLGQSNTVLIQTPGGAHILYNGGRFPSRLLTALGDRLPFNDREIEVLLIAEPDEFETAALSSLLDRYQVGVALTNGQMNLGATFEQINSRLDSTDVVVVQDGYSLTTSDGVQIEILNPGRLPDATEDMNPAVLVARMTYGEVSFLLTGDLSQEGQVALLSRGRWPLATVLQLPDHGTRGSLDTGFLAAVQPQLAIIQVDPANRRGDPEPDVLLMLDETPLYRTDQQGTIHLWTDGSVLWAQPEK
jgi:competence protein ComEC